MTEVDGRRDQARLEDVRAVLLVDRCATDDEHDPEGATIAFERARVGALLDQARNHLADIDDALTRLDRGQYGRCERCGMAIAVERLEGRPVARTCIGCAA